MLDADGFLVKRLWITVPTERDLDTVAQEVREKTGVIAEVNDREQRWICIGAPKHRVDEIRKTLARLGYISQAQ